MGRSEPFLSLYTLDLELLERVMSLLFACVPTVRFRVQNDFCLFFFAQSCST